MRDAKGVYAGCLEVTQDATRIRALRGERRLLTLRDGGDGVSGLPITPETKVEQLLEAWPELEETLVAIAPAFASRKNPILRKTVARVATLLRLP